MMMPFYSKRIGVRRLLGAVGMALVLALGMVQPARAVDPVYQPDMAHLAEIMGGLYFLQPLCGFAEPDWRQETAELIDLDAPDDDRRARLYGAFNSGYEAYARLHRTCTPSANEAMWRLLSEAEAAARAIRNRFAE